MITAILDTNVFVQAAISPRQGASLRALRAYDDGRYRLIFSPAALDEILKVLSIPPIRARHGWSNDQILRFTISLLHTADIYPGERQLGRIDGWTKIPQKDVCAATRPLR